MAKLHQVRSLSGFLSFLSAVAAGSAGSNSQAAACNVSWLQVAARLFAMLVGFALSLGAIASSFPR